MRQLREHGTEGRNIHLLSIGYPSRFREDSP